MAEAALCCPWPASECGQTTGGVHDMHTELSEAQLALRVSLCVEIAAENAFAAALLQIAKLQQAICSRCWLTW